MTTTTGQGQQTQNPTSTQWDSITQNPTAFKDHLRDLCKRAQASGVSEQEMLDIISQNYQQSGSGSQR